MYKEIFIISVFIATLLLVIHSYRFRGKRKTAIFWGLGFIIMFIREYFYQNIFYGYEFAGGMLSILNVPIAVPMGWLFSAYISQYIAEYIMGFKIEHYIKGEIKVSKKEYESKIIPLYCFASVITATITFAIENTASKMEWWTNPIIEGDFMYPNFILGYMATTFWFLTFINYYTYSTFRDKKILKLLFGFWTASFIRELTWDPKIMENKTLFISLLSIALISLLIAMSVSKQFAILTSVMMFCYILSEIVEPFIPIIYQNFILMIVYISIILLYGIKYLYPQRDRDHKFNPNFLL